MKKNHLSQKLKYYRKLKHLTQQQLSEKLGVSHQMISYYENGKRECSIDCLIEVADVLGITVGEFER